MGENWRIQLSVKDQDVMLNIRADQMAEFAALVEEAREHPLLTKLLTPSEEVTTSEPTKTVQVRVTETPNVDARKAEILAKLRAKGGKR